MRWWLPPLAWAALIWNLSALPLPPGAPLFPGADKLVHALVYAILALLLCRALWKGGVGASARGAAVGAALLAAGYGVTDEVHQLFVPTRFSSAADALADLWGASLAAGLWYVRMRSRPPRELPGGAATTRGEA